MLYSHWFFGLFFLAEEELIIGDKKKAYDVFIIYDDDSENDKELVHILNNNYLNVDRLKTLVTLNMNKDVESQTFLVRGTLTKLFRYLAAPLDGQIDIKIKEWY